MIGELTQSGVSTPGSGPEKPICVCSRDAQCGCMQDHGRDHENEHARSAAHPGPSAAQFGTTADIVGAMATPTLRLGVVDDHPAILRGVLAGLRELLPQLTSPISAATVEELLGALGDTMFLDVVVLDVQLADDSDPAGNVARLVDAGLPVLLYTQEGRRSVTVGRERLHGGAVEQDCPACRLENTRHSHVHILPAPGQVPSRKQCMVRPAGLPLAVHPALQSLLVATSLFWR